MRKTLERGFLISAGVLLLTTALAKFYTTFGTARALEKADELLLISNRTVLFSVSLIELLIVASLVFGVSQRLKVLSILWLSSMFLLYRGARWYYGITGPCTCLGSLTENLPMKAETTDFVLACIVLYLFAGSGWMFLSAWLKEGRALKAENLGGRLAEENSALGTVARG